MPHETTNPATVSGGCQCGSVRYRAPAEPVALYVCHCTECRRQSASAFGISYTIARDALEQSQGEVRYWARPTRLGHTLDCAFCPQCGTRLWHQSSGSPNTLNIKGGTLDAGLDLARAVHIWTSRKLPGVTIPDDARSFPEGPE